MLFIWRADTKKIIKKITMKKLIIAVFCCLPFTLFAQQSGGIKFIDGMNWQQVLAKAKQENKFIFVDMMATWCGPCKMMDNFTYPKAEVGEAFRQNFISVKVQVDSTAKDNENVKSWYRDAKYLEKQYNVTALPTLLFFSPDGKLVHRGTGLKNVAQLIELSKDALNPDKQLYTLLERYSRGEKQDMSKLPDLSQTAKDAGDDSLAASIAATYLESYLFKKSIDSLTQGDIYFMATHINNSKDKIFALFMDPKAASSINTKMQKAGFAPNYAQLVTDGIITKEEVSPHFPGEAEASPKEPDWKKINKNIQKKYGKETAARIMLKAKQVWYYSIKDWKNFSLYAFKKFESSGIGSSFMDRAGTNNLLYSVIFKNVDDAGILEKAARWAKKIVDADAVDTTASLNLRANNIDTYANLLYKAGNKEDAIMWQQKAARLDEEYAKQNNTKPQDVFNATLEKMRNNKPTWTEDN